MGVFRAKLACRVSKQLRFHALGQITVNVPTLCKEWFRMCFSLQASVAAAATGVASSVFVLLFLHDRVDDPFVRQSAAILPAMLLTPVLVQCGDAVAHVQHARGATQSSWEPAIVVWLAILSQPLVLSVTSGALLGGEWVWVLVLNGLVVAASVALSLGFDNPLETWLTLEVVRKEGKIANVVHGMWAYGELATWRVAAYAGTLTLSGVALLVLASRVADRDDPYADVVSVYMTALSIALIALYFVSELYVNYVSRVRLHTSSVWCAVSLLATTTLGFYLMVARNDDGWVAAVFVIVLVSTYAFSYALAGQA